MRILHTSDWHIGRTFHGYATEEHLERVLRAMAGLVRVHGVDVVVVAGDVFDHSAPKAEAFALLNRAVGWLREAGAVVVLTSGNHDGPARLGHLADFAVHGGVHVRTEVSALAQPVMIDDDDGGPVAFYALPYLHPALLSNAFPEFSGTTHAEALGFAMARVREDHTQRGGRWVVAAHCFAQNVAAPGGAAGLGVETADETREDGGLTEERDITRGGLDLVPVPVFDSPHVDAPDYVALGHIHGRTTFSERVRYSGAPLRYSFGERDKPRGAWLVELGASAGAAPHVTWLDLPVPRPIARLEGRLADLLAPGAHEEARESWVEAVLTDDVLPHEAMRRLRGRYPYAVTLTHQPQNRVERADLSYAERVRGRSETELLAEFLAFVRDGHGPNDAESAVLAEALAARDAAEVAQ